MASHDDAAARNPAEHGMTIAVLGETPYAEGQGDGQAWAWTATTSVCPTCSGAGIPTVVVLVSGRPLVVASQLAN